jgi:SET domain-containing protein
MPVTAADLSLKRSATGLGLFALRDIPRGRRIIEYVGELITDKEADRRRGKYLFDLGDGRCIDGRSRANLARYVNHSCRPNATAYVTGRRVWVWSRRRILAGEEITIDYGPAYFDEHIRPKGCRCAACQPGRGTSQRPYPST